MNLRDEDIANEPAEAQGATATRAGNRSRRKALFDISDAWQQRLNLPAGHAAADGGLALAQKVDEALARLVDGSDLEALHDFRVAVRRLRTWLQGFKSVLAVRRRTRRRLKSLARATNAARDAEVALAWLDAKAAHLGATERRALNMLNRELAAGLEETNKRLGTRIDRCWKKTARGLRRELMDRSPERGVSERFGQIWADALEAAIKFAAERRRQASRECTAKRVHRYRIALKRVRYLLEPAEPAFADARAAVKQAKRYQNRAGSINDLQHFLDWLHRSAREFAVEQGESLLKLRLDGRDAEARRLALRGARLTTALVRAGRLARADLESELRTFVAEAGAPAPNYAREGKRIARAMRRVTQRAASPAK